jgi:hypothetical protein
MLSLVGLNKGMEKTAFAIDLVGGSDEKRERLPVISIPSATAFRIVWNCRFVLTIRGRMKTNDIPRPYRAIWYIAGRMKLYDNAPRISPKMTNTKKIFDSDNIRLLFWDQCNFSLLIVLKNINAKSPSAK